MQCYQGMWYVRIKGVWKEYETAEAALTAYLSNKYGLDKEVVICAFKADPKRCSPN